MPITSRLSDAFPSRSDGRHGRVAGIVGLVCLAVAALWLLTSLMALVNFAWPQPLYDQFRLYLIYLTESFPANVLELENGHRPILPALLRVAEIHAFAANQHLQIVVGAMFALGSALFLARAAWRETALPVPARASGVLIAMLAVLWMGNARMLLHGNELVHAYLLTLSVMLGAACVERARSGNVLAWMSAATVCGMIATFSFGPGIATFAALFLVALSARIRPAGLLVLIAGCVVSLALYMAVLPGSAGVRGMLAFDPLESFLAMTRWLASPWVNAWLGLADPPLAEWLDQSLSGSWLGRVLIGSAGVANAALGNDWRALGSVLIGLAGLAALAIHTLRALLRPQATSRLDRIALALGLFGAATAAIMGLGRLEFFRTYPDQVFAERYLVWPCLFWAGLALLTHGRLRGRSLRLANGSAVAVMLIALALLPTHHAWIGWGSVVYRYAQRSAASARADALDAEVFPDDDSARFTTVVRVLDLFRERGLAMFSEPGSGLLGRKIASLQTDTSTQVQWLAAEAFGDARNGASCGHLAGWITSGISRVAHGGPLVVVDDDGRVMGYAEFSFIAPNARPLRLDAPRKRGFDAYLRELDAHRTYRLVQLELPGDSGSVLATIPGADFKPRQ